MPRLSDTVRSALADWWQLAVSEAFAGTTATDTIVLANAMAKLAGRTLSFAESSAISSLYGYGRRMFNASAAVIAAADRDYISPEHVATPPWAREEHEQNTYPIWHVTYQFTYIDATGVQHTEHKTSIFEVNFPQTIGELRDAIDADAQALASKYRVSLVGTELHQILAV